MRREAVPIEQQLRWWDKAVTRHKKKGHKAENFYARHDAVKAQGETPDRVVAWWS